MPPQQENKKPSRKKLILVALAILAAYVIFNTFYYFSDSVTSFLESITGMKTVGSTGYNIIGPSKFITVTGREISNWIFVILLAASLIIWDVVKNKSFKRQGFIVAGFIVLSIASFYLIYTKYSPLVGKETRCAVMPSFFLKEGKDLCYYNLALAKSDASLCGKMPGVYYYKGQCYDTLARRNNDRSLCSQIPSPSGETYSGGYLTVYPYQADEYLRDECFNYFAQSTSTGMTLSDKEELCNVIRDFANKSGCIENLAVQNKDPSICEILSKMDIDYYMSKTDFEAGCYKRMAYELNRSDLCEMVYQSRNSGFYYSQCIKDFFQKDKSSGFCDKMKTPDGRAHCLDYINYIK
jgi:hypothetical protein